MSYTPWSGQQQSDDGAFPSDGAKSKSNRLLVIDNLDFFFERRFASLSPMQVSREIDVLLLTVEMSTFASLAHSGSHRPYPLVDNLDFFLERRFASLSPIQVSLEIDVLLLTVEMSTFASLVHSGSHRPYPLDAPSAPDQ